MDNDLVTITEFRKQFETAVKDVKVSVAIDERDVTRLDNSDKYVMCFVHWRKGDVAAAVNLAVDVLKWRKDKAINDITTNNLNLELLQRGVIFVHGRALDNTRLVYFVARFQTKEIKQQVQQIMCLWLERLHHQETGKHITFLLDVSKTGMNNVDLGGIKFLLECFTLYFPDMLERIIILEMPWIMNAVWKIVKQWMTEEQRKRTVFCNFKGLKEYVDEDNMLSYMGGKDTWDYSYPLPPNEIPSLELQINYDSVEDEEQLRDECKSVSDCSDNEEEYIVDDVDIRLTESELPSTATTVNDRRLIDDADASIHETEKSFDISMSQNNTSKATLQSNAASDMQEVDDVSCNYSPLKPELTEMDGAHDITNVEKNTPKTVNRIKDGKSAKPLFRVQPIKRNLSNEINLRSLLRMSPITEVVFRQDSMNSKTKRYHATITLTNPNPDGEVAFKVKTNSPQRYYVKPSAGFVDAGATTSVFIHLIAGQEEEVSKDRFLVLYQKKEGDCNVTEFWGNHADKEARYEHRVRVRFDNVSALSQGDKLAVKNNPVSLKPEPPSVVDELKTLSKELSRLKTEVTSSARNLDRFRTKFKYFIILQLIIVAFLLYIVYRLNYLPLVPSPSKLGQFQCNSPYEHAPSR